jgi:hypothetical protein
VILPTLGITIVQRLRMNWHVLAVGVLAQVRGMCTDSGSPVAACRCTVCTLHEEACVAATNLINGAIHTNCVYHNACMHQLVVVRGMNLWV